MEAQLSGVSGMSIILVLFMSAVAVQATPIDVHKFGAKCDEKTDLSKPLLDAWKEACASATPATVLIPKGNYFLSHVKLEGPCKAPIELQVQGTIKAPADVNAFKEPMWVVFNRIQNFKISGGGVFDGQGTQAYQRLGCGKNGFCSHLPINIRLDYLTNVMIEDITTKDSKQFHINVLGCKNITFERFTVSAPQDSPNTDGIHIGRSEGVNVINTEIKTGDDCVSLGDGAKNVVVKSVTCGPGHGISIGSLGLYQNEEPVKDIKVSKCTLTNTMNGVRIKTWPNSYPGVASDMHFEDITMKNVDNPIIIDQKYCPWNRCNLKEESKVKLSNISFKTIKGTSSLPEAIKIICSAGNPCQNVELANIDIKHTGSGPAVSVCSNVKPKITGTVSPTACSTASDGASSARKLMQ